MKYSSIIVLTTLLVHATLLTSCQSSQSVNTSTPKIKTIQVYKIEPNTDEKTLKSLSDYDKNGNEIQQIYYQSDGSKTTVNFEYDKSGNLLKATDNEGIRLESIYKNNLVIEEKTRYEKITYEYNDKGDLTNEKTYDDDGQLDDWKRYVYEYDNDKVLKKETYERQGEQEQLVAIHTYSYNKNGQVVEEDLKGIYDQRNTKSEYSTNGNLKQTTELAFGNKEKIIRTFNENGQKVKEEVYRRNSTEEEFQLSVVNEHKYDEFGNMTTRKHSRGGKLYTYEVMEITYY